MFGRNPLCFFAVALLIFSGTAAADHQTEFFSGSQPVCESGGVEFCVGSSAGDVCSQASGRFAVVRTQLRIVDFGLNDNGSCLIEHCSVNATADQCSGAGDFTYGSTTIGISERIIEHTEEDEAMCESGQNGTFFVDGPSPPLSFCSNGCSQLANSAEGGTNDDGDFRWIVDATSTGSQCSADDAGGDGNNDDLSEEDRCTGGFHTDSAGNVICSADNSNGQTDSEEQSDNTGGDTDDSSESSESSDQSSDNSDDDTSSESGDGDESGDSTSGGTGTGGGTGEGDDSGTDSPTDDNDDDCPSNMFELVGGVLTCSTLVPDQPDTGGDEVTDNGSFSGGETCDSVPSCSGDTLLCAIALQQWRARCDVDLPTDSEIVDQTGLTDFNDVDLLREDSISIDGFDSSGFLTARACPANPTITLLGSTHTIDLTHLCTVGNIIGIFVVFGGFLHSSRILFTA